MNGFTHNLDASQKHDTEPKKPESKDNPLYKFHLGKV